MAVIKLSVSAIIFYFLWQLSDYITPLFSWATNIFFLGFIAWTAGKYLTKKFIFQNVLQVSAKGKAVLVTGCNSGFGNAVALDLAKEGFHVFACCLNPEEEAAKDLVSQGRRLTVVPLDVIQDDSVKKCFETVQDFLNDSSNDVKELFAIINNAGIVDNRAVEMTTPPNVDDVKKLLDVNFLGMVRVTRMFLPLIRKSKGRVINTSSIAARIAIRNFSAYSSSKAAVSKFSDCLQMELSGQGVKVVVIEPWVARTRMLTAGAGKEGFLKAWKEETSQEVKDAYGQRYVDTFLGHYKQMEEKAMDPERVTRRMKEAVTSPEPDAVYRVAPPKVDWLLWTVNEFVPQDLRCHLRNLLESIGSQLKKE